RLPRRGRANRSAAYRRCPAARVCSAPCEKTAPWRFRYRRCAGEGSDRPALAVEQHDEAQQLVDGRAVGGERDDTGLDRAVVRMAAPERRPLAPGRTAGLDHEAEPVA